MSSVHQIGLDKKLQPQPQLGHSNSSHHAPIPSTSYAPHSTSSSSSSSATTAAASKRASNQPDHGDNSDYVVSFGSETSAVVEHDDNSNESCGTYADEPNPSPFNSQWVCSQDFVLHRTPSRKDDMPHYQEMQQRRKGASFIRQMAHHLKLKSLCKETAFVYFHRFYMLRSLKKYEPYRIAMACLYLACKVEDHPTFKEHLVRISYLFIMRKDLLKTDKEYAEWCDRLIRDENLLLQVLGFNLQVSHFQAVIVESSQKPMEGTTRDLYTTAYKVSSEINRLTMLCVEQPTRINACVAIYLASVYQGTALPDEWTANIKGATAQDMELVLKIGEEYKERIAKESDLVKGILKESGVKCPMPANVYCSPGDSSRGSTPSHSYFPRTDQLSQQIMTTFSPDSAYSSNSSHSPPENANYGSQPRHHAQAHHSSSSSQPSHSNSMMNYPPQIHHNKPSKQQQSQMLSASYSPTASTSSCYANSSSQDGKQRTSSAMAGGSRPGMSVAKTSAHSHHHHHGAAAAGQSNTHSLLAQQTNSNKKRTLPPSSSSASASNLNHADSYAGSVGPSDDAHRKRLKSDQQPHLTGKQQRHSHQHLQQQQHQSISGHMHGGSNRPSGGGHISNNRLAAGKTNSAGLPFIGVNQQHMGSTSQYHQSMPHF